MFVMLRPILSLFSGVVTAQIFNILAIVYAAKYISPAEMGYYALIMSSSAMVSLIVTMRLETSFMSRVDENDVKNSFSITIHVSIINSSVLSILCLVFFELHYLIVFVLGFNLSVINSFSSYLNYFKNYVLMSRMRILVPGLFFLFTVLMVFFEVKAFNVLVAAQCFASSVGVVILVFIANNQRAWSLQKRVDIVSFLKEANHFTLYNGLQALAGRAQDFLVLVIVNSVLGPVAVGFYSFAQRLTSVPLGMIAEVLGKVCQVEVKDRTNQGIKETRQFLFSLIAGLAVIAIISIVAINLVSGFFVDYFLDASWHGLDNILVAMSVYVSIHFMAAAVSSFPIALGKPKAVSLLGVFGSALYLTVFTASLANGLDLVGVFRLLTAVMIVYYIYFIWWVVQIVTDSVTVNDIY